MHITRDSTPTGKEGCREPHQGPKQSGLPGFIYKEGKWHNFLQEIGVKVNFCLPTYFETKEGSIEDKKALVGKEGHGGIGQSTYTTAL